jgi:hypothetical protein
MELPVYKLVIDETDEISGVNFVALVDEPAIMKTWQLFNSTKQTFKIDNERRIISGALMIADLPIPRRDNERGEYFVIFDAPTVQTIQRKFMAKGYTKNFNIMHDPNQVTQSVILFNSFIIDSQLGIKTPDNYDVLPDGSWFGSVFVADEQLWQSVKEGKFTGFSVEGFFDLIYQKEEKDTDIIKQIEQILDSNVQN